MFAGWGLIILREDVNTYSRIPIDIPVLDKIGGQEFTVQQYNVNTYFVFCLPPSLYSLSNLLLPRNCCETYLWELLYIDVGLLSVLVEMTIYGF